jgi:group II intron reverse transcriptase/maturase
VKPEAPREERSDRPAAADPEAHPAAASLWEQCFSRENLAAALRRVEINAGAAGIDGMQARGLRPWLKEHWPKIRRQLDAGTYLPQPVRRVKIPKPSGGERELGVPTALDRMIQQALQQVLTPIFDPGFADESFGFRPGRSAHGAVEAARRHLDSGAEWVVDLDLDRFFDRVQHDRLMARVASRVHDKRALKLIRSYLEAGVMADGVKQPSEEGAPQGSPLSPLLSNVYLSELDRELGRRGHRFVRYADDVMIYVRSERAGQRVMEGISAFIEQRLRLRVNRRKSAVAWAGRRPFLGFAFFKRKDGWKLGVDREAPKRARRRLRQLTARTWGVPMERRIFAINRFTRGWTAYFALAEGERPFRDLDEWLRRRLRQVRWKEWKLPKARRRNLQALGIPARSAREWAMTGKGYWRVAGSWVLTRALPNTYWRDQGLLGFTDPYRRLRDAERAARCGPACLVAWEGPE